MRKKLRNTAIVLAIILLMLCGTAVALMVWQTGFVSNQFESARVDCVVHEATDSGSATGGEMRVSSKTEIKVENTGNIPAYIRLRLVSYWVDGDGNIVGKPSVMPSIPYDTDNWIKKGDTYYYKGTVDPTGFTPDLLEDNASIVLAKDDGCYQVLDVFADAIQGEPDSAVTNSWGVTLKDGEIQ